MKCDWPITLTNGEVVLRSLSRRDGRQWQQLRRGNVEWLREWEATLPLPDPTIPADYRAMIRSQAKDARAGRAISLGIEFRGVLVGQITLGGLSWGSLRSGYVGYWISRRSAGQGVTPLAVAMLGDYAFDQMQLHRIEINVRPENQSSLRVVAKLGFRFEGTRRGYLHINGDWRDHLSYAMLTSERPRNGLVRHLYDASVAERRPK